MKMTPIRDNAAAPKCPLGRQPLVNPVVIEAHYLGVHYVVSRETDGSRRLVSPLSATTASILAPPIAFCRVYVKITHSLPAALMLSHAVEEARRAHHNEEEADGWFAKTVDAWQQETGLSRHEQVMARRALRDIGVLDEKLSGQPPTLHFRVNFAQIYDLIHGTHDGILSEVDLSPGALLDILGEVIAINRAYIHLLGSIPAGVLLSFLHQMCEDIPGAKDAGGFVMSLQEVMRRTGLSMFELSSARRLLSEREFAYNVPPSTDQEGHVWLLSNTQITRVEHALMERSNAENAEIEQMARLIGLME